MKQETEMIWISREKRDRILRLCEEALEKTKQYESTDSLIFEAVQKNAPYRIGKAGDQENQTRF